MKLKCEICNRNVGVNKDGSFVKHRVKRGRKNKKKGERHPYCKP